jgi:hypothetical protein
MRPHLMRCWQKGDQGDRLFILGTAFLRRGLTGEDKLDQSVGGIGSYAALPSATR